MQKGAFPLSTYLMSPEVPQFLSDDDVRNIRSALHVPWQELILSLSAISS
jgi:hypothetical protein